MPADPLSRDPAAAPVTPLRRGAAFGVHLFTASGAVAGLLALLATADGAYRPALLLMLLALAIDSLDGMLARAVGVADAVPEVDGRRLDDVVDYGTYVLVPAFFLVRTGLLPHWSLAALPVLASAWGFSRVQAKTDDDFFLGFPSYWNVVALYAWLLGTGPLATSLVVTGLSILVIVPWRYVYPSHMGALRRTHHALAATSALLVVWALLDPARAEIWPLVELSLAHPVFYLAASLWQGGRRRRE